MGRTPHVDLRREASGTRRQRLAGAHEPAQLHRPVVAGGRTRTSRRASCGAGGGPGAARCHEEQRDQADEQASAHHRVTTAARAASYDVPPSGPAERSRPPSTARRGCRTSCSPGGGARPGHGGDRARTSTRTTPGSSPPATRVELRLLDGEVSEVHLASAVRPDRVQPGEAATHLVGVGQRDRTGVVGAGVGEVRLPMYSEVSSGLSEELFRLAQYFDRSALAHLRPV